MKKIIYVILLIIIIPYIVISLFIYDDEIKFNYTANMKVRVKRNATGKIDEIPLEEYVSGVLAGEMPAEFSLEALKAQAVAARTYVMKRLSTNKKNEYDVIDTVQNQVYLDENQQKQNWGNRYTELSNKIKQAVLETNSEYLVYNGKIIDALFFSTSIGVTENSEDIFPKEIPYLRSVSSTWDSVSPLYDKEYYFTLKKFYDLLGLEYKDKVTVEIISKTNTGRIKKIKINDKTFTGWELCNKLGLKSNYYTITQNNDSIKVVARGYGHGVGMSQYGAEGMSRAGYTYDQILYHYYQGTKIKKI